MGREYSGEGRIEDGTTVWREDSGEEGQWVGRTMGCGKTEGREDRKSWWDREEGGPWGMVGQWGGRSVGFGGTVGS